MSNSRPDGKSSTSSSSTAQNDRAQVVSFSSSFQPNDATLDKLNRFFEYYVDPDHAGQAYGEVSRIFNAQKPALPQFVTGTFPCILIYISETLDSARIFDDTTAGDLVPDLETNANAQAWLTFIKAYVVNELFDDQGHLRAEIYDKLITHNAEKIKQHLKAKLDLDVDMPAEFETRESISSKFKKQLIVGFVVNLLAPEYQVQTYAVKETFGIKVGLEATQKDRMQLSVPPEFMKHWVENDDALEINADFVAAINKQLNAQSAPPELQGAMELLQGRIQQRAAEAVASSTSTSTTSTQPSHQASTAASGKKAVDQSDSLPPDVTEREEYTFVHVTAHDILEAKKACTKLVDQYRDGQMSIAGAIKNRDTLKLAGDKYQKLTITDSDLERIYAEIDNIYSVQVKDGKCSLELDKEQKNSSKYRLDDRCAYVGQNLLHHDIDEDALRAMQVSDLLLIDAIFFEVLAEVQSTLLKKYDGAPVVVDGVKMNDKNASIIQDTRALMDDETEVAQHVIREILSDEWPTSKYVERAKPTAFEYKTAVVQDVYTKATPDIIRHMQQFYAGENSAAIATALNGAQWVQQAGRNGTITAGVYPVLKHTDIEKLLKQVNDRYEVAYHYGEYCLKEKQPAPTLQESDFVIKSSSLTREFNVLFRELKRIGYTENDFKVLSPADVLIMHAIKFSAIRTFTDTNKYNEVSRMGVPDVNRELSNYLTEMKYLIYSSIKRNGVPQIKKPSFFQRNPAWKHAAAGLLIGATVVGAVGLTVVTGGILGVPALLGAAGAIGSVGGIFTGVGATVAGATAVGLGAAAVSVGAGIGIGATGFFDRHPHMRSGLIAAAVGLAVVGGVALTAVTGGLLAPAIIPGLAATIGGVGGYLSGTAAVVAGASVLAAGAAAVSGFVGGVVSKVGSVIRRNNQRKRAIKLVEMVTGKKKNAPHQDSPAARAVGSTAKTVQHFATDPSRRQLSNDTPAPSRSGSKAHSRRHSTTSVSTQGMHSHRQVNPENKPDNDDIEREESSPKGKGAR